MGDWSLLRSARVARRMTQETLARRAGTSQSTLSAYERGIKTPSLAVAERILYALGYRLDVRDVVTFHSVVINDDGWIIHVPDRLWRLDPPHCFTTVYLDNRAYDLTNSRERTEAYVQLIEHCGEEKIFRHIDAALLVAAWPAMSRRLREPVREAWDPLVHDASSKTKWVWENIARDIVEQDEVRRASRQRRLDRARARAM